MYNKALMMSRLIIISLFFHAKWIDGNTLSDQFSQKFRLHQEYVLKNNNITIFEGVDSMISCASRCVSYTQCRGFTFSADQHLCEIKDKVADCSLQDLQPPVNNEVYYHHLDATCIRSELDLVGLPSSQSTDAYPTSGHAHEANDGDIRTTYSSGSCTHTVRSNGQWWMVDMQKSKCIQKVIIYNRGDCCRDRLDGAVIRVGGNSDRSNPECGVGITMTQINLSPIIEMSCDLCGRYLSIHLPDTTNEALTICEVRAYVEECPTHAALPSCAAIQNACYSGGSGIYEIDPDGPNYGVEAFEVLCDMSSGATIIGHESEGDFETPPGFETPGSYIKDIVYQASIQQIAAVIDVSTHCEQYLKYECYGTAAYSGADVCKAGWPIVARGGPDSGGWTMVSTDKPFLCDGQVTKWTYQGKNSSPFRAIIFRPISGSVTEFQIVGINDIPAGTINTPVDYIVPENERIDVEQGDLIGWSHGPGVITYNGGGSYNVRWVRAYLSADLEVNQILNINSGGGTREYSIEATVQSAAEWNVWWESRDGEKMCNFGNVATGTADCTPQPGCDNGGVCNCITNDWVRKSDEGILSNKTKLPVTKIHSGDTGDTGESAIFTLGALKCSG